MSKARFHQPIAVGDVAAAVADAALYAPEAALLMRTARGSHRFHQGGRACPGFDPVINARIDVHFHKGPVEEGLRRARKYLDAGADCVYPIFLCDASAIREYVALGPANTLYAPGSIALGELATLGVPRISVASFLFRLLIKRLQLATDTLRRFDDEGFGPEWKPDLLDLKLL